MRLETGVFQPADDWPGIFIRGDNALMGYLPALEQAIRRLNESRDFSDRIAEGQLKSLANLLSKCDARMPQTGNAVTFTGTQWSL